MALTEKLRRPKAFVAAALLILASVIPLITHRQADAYGLITNRQITMSSSANGTEPDGQGVTYEVEFDVATDSEDIAGVVVEFCANSPIIGDTCTAASTVGFDTNFATTTLNLINGLAGFTIDTTNSTASKLIITGTADDVGPGETITFDFEGIDNPETTNQTFYARIVTYTTAAGAEEYDSTDIGNDPVPVIDAGGIALSTAEQIDVTAKVQEQLDFCVYTSAINVDSDCVGASYTPLVLGDNNGVLSVTGPYVNKEAKYSVATNAASGVAIRMTGSTLTSGSFTITANGEGTQAGAASAPGTEQFGLCTYNASGEANLTPDTVYDGDNSGTDQSACSGTTQTAGTTGTGGDNGAFFAFDDSASGTNSLYGEVIANKSAGDFSAGVISMIGNIAYTTEAGIYETTLTFIATGTY